MTIQQHLTNLATLQDTVRQAQLSLSPSELRAYRSLLSVFQRLLSYAPGAVRHAVVATLTAHRALDLAADGTASQLRDRLLAAILRSGKQDMLTKFVLRFLFTDVSLAEWCHTHDIAYMSWTRESPSGPVEFITFDKAHTDN